MSRDCDDVCGGFWGSFLGEWSSSGTHLDCFMSLETCLPTPEMVIVPSGQMLPAPPCPLHTPCPPVFLRRCQSVPSFPPFLTSLLPLGCGFDCICAVHAVRSCWHPDSSDFCHSELRGRDCQQPPPCSDTSSHQTSLHKWWEGGGGWGEGGL